MDITINSTKISQYDGPVNSGMLFELDNINGAKISRQDGPTKQTASLRSLMSANKTEWPFITLGVAGAVLQGLVLPVYAILFGNILTVSRGYLHYEVQFGTWLHTFRLLRYNSNLARGFLKACT